MSNQITIAIPGDSKLFQSESALHGFHDAVEDFNNRTGFEIKTIKNLHSGEIIVSSDHPEIEKALFQLTTEYQRVAARQLFVNFEYLDNAVWLANEVIK